jgi:hypothetical protein
MDCDQNRLLTARRNRNRALALLAACAHSSTEVLLLAHGFKTELLELVASPLRSPLLASNYSIVILGAARARPFSSVAFTWRAMAR